MSGAHTSHVTFRYATRIPARNDANGHLTETKIARLAEGAKGSRGSTIAPECVCARTLGRVLETPEPSAPSARLAVLRSTGESCRKWGV